VLFVDPVANVKDLEWIDDLSYVALFKVSPVISPCSIPLKIICKDRAEYHATETVNPDNDRVDAIVGSPLMRSAFLRLADALS
jgi:hypothetical protein